MSNQLSDFLGRELLPLFEDGEKLISSVSAMNAVYGDYSFTVFPFAKVYEGFLKKLFLQIGAIDNYQYNNDRWRVGRALNPQLEKDLRHTESVYDRLVELCNPELPEVLWRAWKRGRNQIFHFWPGRTRPLSFSEAKEIVGEIEEAMEAALRECAIFNEQSSMNEK